MEIRELSEFLRYFQRVRDRTRAVAVLIPPDRLEWSPGRDRFTFGDLIRHIAATERWMFAENVSGRPSRYPGHGPELADGYDQVLGYLDEMHAQAMDIFSGLTPDRLEQRCPTPGGVELRTWKWLRAMIEHEVHHRGQMYWILGTLGVAAPPLYGLTEPQVRERSVQP